MSSGRKRPFQSEDWSEPPLKHSNNEDYETESCFSSVENDPYHCDNTYTCSSMTESTHSTTEGSHNTELSYHSAEGSHNTEGSHDTESSHNTNVTYSTAYPHSTESSLSTESPYSNSNTIPAHSLPSWSSGTHLTVIDSNGCSKNLRVKTNREMEISTQKVSSVYGGQLLFVPFHKLLEAVEEKRHKQLMETSDDNSILNDSQQQHKSAVGTVSEKKNEPEKGTLWSDKYSPKHFTDLLSDDGINRTVLSWIKLWDETVFGDTSLIKKPKQQFDNKNKKGWNPAAKKFKATSWEVQDPQHFGTEQALDETRRPKQKVVLLCGPPGLGKTTLVHIAAKHSGYNVVEMNASDDRSPEVFKKVLESSTEMQAVLTANSKPNCLVIDEIDGAPVTAINVLIDVIKSRNKSATKKSKQSKSILSRPIICICNDLYTPSLRTLRQFATVIPVPQTITSRLASRLLEICKQEDMNASISVLMALCEKTDNDIRTCLNTLQFINRKHGELSIGSIKSTSIGKKDTRKSHLTFLKDVFKLPPAKKASFDANTGLYNRDTPSTTLQSQRLLDILSSAYRTGEHDKVLQGIYENYLEVKVRDPNLNLMTEMQDWIIFNELLNTEVMTSQEYILMSYLPFLSVAFHFYFATSSGHRIKYPSSDYEAYQLHQKNQQILSSLVSDSTPFVRRNISNMSTVDFIPMLLNIIAPSFRPVNPQLYTKWEKHVLASVIGTMISYNLTYHQEQIEGQYTFIMDPNIERLCSYSLQTQKKQLPYIIKQMLAREIELEKVKSKSKPPLSDTVARTNNDSSRANSKRHTDNNFSSKQPEKIIQESIRPQRDFFGRVIPPKIINKKDEENAKRKSTVLSTSLWFKFNKGFSDAVKRPVLIKDLM